MMKNKSLFSASSKPSCLAEWPLTQPSINSTLPERMSLSKYNIDLARINIALATINLRADKNESSKTVYDGNKPRSLSENEFLLILILV